MRDVAFTCDDNGAKFLRVSVYSLLSHYRGSEPIRINILEGYGGHSAENRRALEDLIAKFPGTVVRYVNVEKAVEPYADLIMNRADSRWNIFTWTPIFGPDLLPDVTGNLIHFDIDLLFNADVSPLFEMDLADKLFAVAYEYHYAPGSRHNAVWDNGILPPSVERYFNTGVVVFNTQKCRAEQTAKQILDWYRAHYDIADRIEQDAYNALFLESHRRPSHQVESARSPIEVLCPRRFVRQVLVWKSAARMSRSRAQSVHLALLGTEETMESFAPSLPQTLSRRNARGRPHAPERTPSRAVVQPHQRARQKTHRASSQKTFSHKIRSK